MFIIVGHVWSVTSICHYQWYAKFACLLYGTAAKQISQFPGSICKCVAECWISFQSYQGDCHKYGVNMNYCNLKREIFFSCRETQNYFPVLTNNKLLKRVLSDKSGLIKTGPRNSFPSSSTGCWLPQLTQYSGGPFDPLPQRLARVPYLKIKTVTLELYPFESLIVSSTSSLPPSSSSAFSPLGTN